MDIFETINEITGLKKAMDVGPDSFSFLSLLEGEKEMQRPPLVYHSVNGTFSIRYGKWKMIFSAGSGGRQKPVGKPFQEPYQLFDIEKDPSETENVIGQHEDVANILSEYLYQIQHGGTSKNFSFD